VSLDKYAAKRSFDATPEPPAVKRGAGRPAARKRRLSFVIQEHQASSLHYDFRLELDGVLKSWAVPKGPTMNPHEHHLAIHVEDHPLEYRNFEGVIPEGNYGAGEVIIWDRGWYEARKGDPAEEEKTLRAELKKGHLTFILHGEKLHGEFALIKMHGAGMKDNSWLLVKKGDEFASEADVRQQAESVKSHLTLDEIGKGSEIDLKDYPKTAAPWPVDPMLCTMVAAPFDRNGWLFEIKWDGYRAIARKEGKEVWLSSRARNDFSAKFPPMVEALRALKRDAVVDGEIVVIDQTGKPHFEWLQNWNKDPRGTLVYYLFDILWCDGHDVRGLPLRERKALLKSVLPSDGEQSGNHGGTLRYSDHVDGDGAALFRQMRRRGLEGMVAKDGASTYREGERGDSWLKVKTHLRQELVIGGYTEPRGGRQYLGSLLVGVYDDGRLVYAGHSGGGIPDAQRRALRDRLVKLERKTSPFAAAVVTNASSATAAVKSVKPNAPVHWVKPELVCEMEFSEWTSGGQMRHPSYKGLRDDKAPAEVRRERAKAIDPTPPPAPKSASATVDLKLPKLPFEPTHLDKVYFPGRGYTKGDLMEYYVAVASYILPYLKDRPCSLNRMPGGITGESFYQKNNEHLPAWAPHTEIFSKSNDADINWLVGNKLETLLYMIQLGCVEINVWNSRVGHLDKPDWAVIDLDPEGVSFAKVVETALVVKQVCDEWKIPIFPKTSGKTGLHLYIPLGAKYTDEQAKNLAHLIVLEVNKRLPKITSVLRLPEKRQRRVYLDFLQNRSGQTLAAPYSVRPTAGATVSMPLHWDEVNSKLKPTDFDITNAVRRLKRVGDLWRPVMEKGIDLADILKNIPSDIPIDKG